MTVKLSEWLDEAGIHSLLMIVVLVDSKPRGVK